MDEDAYKKNNKSEKGGQPGVYKHPMTGTELHATNFPMADAFIRQGWVWDRELPQSEEVRESGVPSPNDVSPTAAADVEALKAQLAAAEKARDDALAQVKANEARTDTQAKADAEATKERTQKQRGLDKASQKLDAKDAEASETLKKEKENK